MLAPPSPASAPRATTVSTGRPRTSSSTWAFPPWRRPRRRRRQARRGHSRGPRRDDTHDRTSGDLSRGCLDGGGDRSASIRSLLAGLRIPRWYLLGELSGPEAELEREMAAIGVGWKVIPNAADPMALPEPGGRRPGDRRRHEGVGPGGNLAHGSVPAPNRLRRSSGINGLSPRTLSCWTAQVLPVRVREPEERPAVLWRELDQLAALDAASDELGASGRAVGDDQLQPLQRARRHLVLGRQVAEHDRAPRAACVSWTTCMCSLCVSWSRSKSAAGAEADRAIDVAHGQDDDFEGPVHDGLHCGGALSQEGALRPAQIGWIASYAANGAGLGCPPSSIAAGSASMNPLIRTGRFPSPPGLVVLVLVVAGCTSTTATPSPSVTVPSAAAVASVEPSTSAEASPSATPVPPPSATPAASPLAWTSPVRALDRRSRRGRASRGRRSRPTTRSAPSTGWSPHPRAATWRGPILSPPGICPDHPSGRPSTAPPGRLPADTLGPAAVVIAAGPAGGTLVALTLQGGVNSCTGGTMPECWTLAAPLQAWTSPDGVSWTPSTAPDITLANDCGSDCSVDVPSVAFGGPGVLVMEASGDSRQLALSTDGASWTDLPATALPAKLQIGGIAGTRDELLAVGDNGKDPARAEVATSTDGVKWTTELLTGQGHPRRARLRGGCSSPRTASCWMARPRRSPVVTCGGRGPKAGPGSSTTGTRRSASGAARAKAPGCFRTAPSSRTGRACSRCGPTGASRPTSTDGATPTSIPSSGLKAQPKGSWPIRDMRMLPAGIVATEDSGARWFGAPAQGG